MFWNQTNNFRFKLNPYKKHGKHNNNVLMSIKSISYKFINKICLFFIGIKNKLHFLKYVYILSKKKNIVLYMLLIIFFTWFLGGFFVVHVNEQGVITNLGKYSYILKNGCYWRPRFITSIHIVDMNSSYLLSDVHNVITVEHDIVKILIKVHYKIINPIQYCFSSANPKRILIQSINNKIYHLSQHVFLRDFFINHGTMFNSFIKNSIQNIINTYHLGVQIIDIDCAKMSFPKYMHMYWKKSILSKKYKEQCILNAEHYADRVLAIALYHAKKILQEVEYYKIRKIAEMKSKRLHIF